MNVASSQAKLDHIRLLLEAGEAEKAIQFIEKGGSQCPEINNALGVCLMRLGRIENAVVVLRQLVLGNRMCIPSDTPPLFQANYATALLLKNHNQPAIEIINNLAASDHSYIQQLKQAIAHWRKSLPVFQRMGCFVRSYPARRVTIPFPPGQA